MRQIPHKGIGYGIARYLSGGMPSKLNPEISFNYLGQFDQDLQQDGVQLSSYSCGSDSSGNQERPYVLNINGMITEGRLKLTISYSEQTVRKRNDHAVIGNDSKPPADHHYALRS
ncbi:condensation domain-containing protein [Bacillus velezensis]|nr:condensation domain-containing protein [Bacillus velezensis]